MIFVSIIVLLFVLISIIPTERRVLQCTIADYNLIMKSLRELLEFHITKSRARQVQMTGTKLKHSKFPGPARDIVPIKCKYISVPSGAGFRDPNFPNLAAAYHGGFRNPPTFAKVFPPVTMSHVNGLLSLRKT